MKKTIEKIIHLSAEISAWFLTIIMILYVLNFLFRYLGHPIEGLVEMGVFVFIAVIFLGIAYCEELDNHVNMEFLLNKFPKNIKNIMKIINYLIITFFSSIFTYSVFLSAYESFTRKEAVAGRINLPIFPVKFIMFFGCFLFLIEVILKLAGYLKTKSKE